MIDFRLFNKVDKIFLETSKNLLLDYLWPANEDQQKKKFLKRVIINPNFTYRGLRYSTSEVEKKLTSIKLPNNPIGRIYTKKVQNKLISNEIIKNRGKKGFVRQQSIKLHKIPPKSLVRYSEKILVDTPRIVYEKSVTASKLKQEMEKALLTYGCKGWQVEATKVKLIGVYPSQKKIKINQDGKYSANALKRLVIHEVGVHVLRSANGYRQPLKIFALGVPGYLATEEGLTTYFEELTGNFDEEKMRDYAGRVIAVDCVCRKLSFRKTFEKLLGYRFGENMAWRLSVRAHRGGGYTKDHIYLKGYLKVTKFAKENGDFKTLYVGKFGIEDLPLIRKLLKEGILKKAKYLPNFI